MNRVGFLVGDGASNPKAGLPAGGAVGIALASCRARWPKVGVRARADERAGAELMLPVLSGGVTEKFRAWSRWEHQGDLAGIGLPVDAGPEVSASWAGGSMAVLVILFAANIAELVDADAAGRGLPDRRRENRSR